MGEGCVDINECETGTHDCFHFKDSHMYTGQELMDTKPLCGQSAAVLFENGLKFYSKNVSILMVVILVTVLMVGQKL